MTVAAAVAAVADDDADEDELVDDDYDARKNVVVGGCEDDGDCGCGDETTTSTGVSGAAHYSLVLGLSFGT